MVFLPCFLFSAVTSTWTGGPSGDDTDWNVSANWTNGIPDGPDAKAIFSKPNVTTTSVLNSSVTVGSIEFGPPAMTIKPLGITETLTFKSSTASIGVSSAGNEIEVPITLSSDLSITFSSNSPSLTLSGIVSGSSQSITINGDGTLTLTKANTYKDTILNSGTLIVAPNSFGTGTVSLNGGTFQPSESLSSSQPFVLSGNSAFDTNNFKLTLSGIIGGDKLTKSGEGALNLSGENTYKGGTLVNQGTLEISGNENLGDSAGVLSLNNSILETKGSFTLASTLGVARAVSLTGNAAISLSGTGTKVTLPGNITGTGTFAVSGSGNTLVLSGESSYLGSTTVTGATLQGTTSNLIGNIEVYGVGEGAVTFDQSGSGTYAGVFSGGSGTSLNLRGGGTYTFSGNSPSSLSGVNVTNGNLILTGLLKASGLTISGNGSLGGTGTLNSSVTNGGTIIPGINGEGTLTVNGDVSFGTLRSEVDPLTNGLLYVVNGTATLNNGLLIISPGDSGFYGLTRDYTLLTATSISGTFASPSMTNPRFIPTVSYSGTSVLLSLYNPTPFLGFPFENSNEKAVGENIDALSVQKLLNDDLILVINALTDQSISAVDHALDQMHPAAFGAFSELQMNLGGQFLSILRRESSFCGGAKPSRFWVEPFGNWLNVETRGKNLGFEATTRGIAVGFEREFLGFWTLGLGGAFNSSDLGWSLDRGYAYLKGAYGAFYTDLVMGRFVLEGACYAGKDWYETMRHIHFTTIDRQATANASGIDIGGRVNCAYYFGTPSFQLYPYLELDYLYLKNSSFTETGAISLNLDVDEYTNSTLRGQTGVTLRFADRNYDDTVCISPLLSMGYLIEAPLYRSAFKARFSGEPISFKTDGWDDLWHLLNLRLGLGITYHSFSLDSLYSVEISPEGGSPYTNQRANFQFSYRF